MDEKTIEIIVKLAKLANNNSNENEANSAARKVCRMLHEDDYKVIGHTPIPSRRPTGYPSGKSPFEDLWNEMNNVRRGRYYSYSNPFEESDYWTRSQKADEEYRKQQAEKARKASEEEVKRKAKEKEEKRQRAQEHRQKSKDGVYAYNEATKMWEYYQKRDLNYHPQSDTWSDKFGNKYKTTFEGYFKRYFEPEPEPEFHFYDEEGPSWKSADEFQSQSRHSRTPPNEQPYVKYGTRQDSERICKKCGLKVKTFRIVTAEDFVCAVCQMKEERGE